MDLAAALANASGDSSRLQVALNGIEGLDRCLPSWTLKAFEELHSGVLEAALAKASGCSSVLQMVLDGIEGLEEHPVCKFTRRQAVVEVARLGRKGAPGADSVLFTHYSCRGAE
jgi:hypothetical protein